MLDDLRMLWRFATGLRRFVQSPLSPEDCRLIVERSMRERERTFLLLLKKAVFGHGKSPYGALLRWAGVEYGDLERMVSQEGVESAIQRLFHAGVTVGLDEFKGRRPIERPGLTLEVAPEDFDNPLLAREFEVETSGTAGPRRRLAIDFDLLAYDAAHRRLLFQAHGIEGRPAGAYRAVPPDSSGIKNVLFAVKFGNPLERWFSPTAISWRPGMFKSAVFAGVAVGGGRLCGGAIPVPKHVSLEDPGPVAEWLASKAGIGTPALLSGVVNSTVRVCLAARRLSLDIAGTVFLIGGEPITEAKASLFREFGAYVCPNYAMSESGPLGGGCADREAIDEVHLYHGKIAMFAHPRLLSDGETTVDALYLTTLLPETPKIMLNLETGDYGVLRERRCDCLLGKLGMRYHLHSIRNYEKLTTGGMHFLGSDVIALVEEALPSAYGGQPTDYQFVEVEFGAITRLDIVVSSRVGEVDENAIVRTVLERLGSGSRSNRMMADHWAQAGTLRLVRRSPYTTSGGKIPPLRVLPR
jgi:hypothetical protein